MKKMTTMDQAYTDRQEAGRTLAALLLKDDWVEPVVLGLARGGLPVAAEVATALEAPLGVTVARKIGAPGHPEFGVGAVTAYGPVVLDDRSVGMLGLSSDDLDSAARQEREEARRRLDLYERNRELEPLSGRDVVVVDDGLATGVTATAALRGLRRQDPRRLVLAAPVCAPQAAAALRHEADRVVCAFEPERFQAVGQWYADFAQTTDDEVIALLDRWRRT